MPGRVTMSVEVELGWGYHDLGTTDPFSDGRVAETERLSALLDLCDRLDVQFTFDVVGALMLPSWPEDLDAPHEVGWFDGVPPTGSADDPLFFAPDLVQAIDDATVDHEIATHTFSHVLFDDLPRSVARWELERARRAHEEFGLDPPVSLVPPRHYRPQADVLRAEGIEIVRTPGYLPAPSKSRKLDRLLLESQPPTPPRLVDGVVETYCTEYTSLTAASLPAGQLPVHPVFRPIPVDVRQHLHERYLEGAVDAAVEADSYTHLWCHLYDMANDRQWEPIRSFLQSLADRRDRGEVEVLTMAGLNEEVRRGDGPDGRAKRERPPAVARGSGGEPGGSR